MLTLACFACGAVTTLDPSGVVADAQIATFVDAHYLHDQVCIRLLLRGRGPVTVAILSDA